MKNRYTIISLVVLFTASALIATAGDKIVVNLRIPPNPYATSRLNDKLDLYFSAINDATIVRNIVVKTTPDETDRVLDFEELMGLGLERNSRYVIDLNFTRIELERRKTTVVPQVINRYRVYAVLRGWMRIIDVEAGSLYKMKAIEFEVKARDRWQFADDNRHDADLMIPPDRKIILFEKLEEQAASGILSIIKELIGGNDN
jgi:hypothetical protein